MKAFAFEEYGLPVNLKLTEVPQPQPGVGEVLVRVAALSINDWDWGLVRGQPFILRMMYGLRKPKINIPGVDISGRVEAVGEGVKDLKAGDEVFGDLSESGFGGFAEFVCAPTDCLALKPSTMSFTEAASLPHAGILAFQGLFEVGRIKRGQTILINGAGGGVGTLCIQLAKSYGAKVTGVDSSAKLDMLRSLGYDEVIDYKKTDFTKTGRQYDLILDTKTNRPARSYARALTKSGTYVTVGGTMPRLFQLLISGMARAIFGNKKLKLLSLKPNKGLKTLCQLFEKGTIKPTIDGPYKFEELPERLHYFGEGKHKGKIVIEMG